MGCPDESVRSRDGRARAAQDGDGDRLLASNGLLTEQTGWNHRCEQNQSW